MIVLSTSSSWDSLSPASYQRKLLREYKWEDFLSSLQSDPIKNLEFCLNCRKGLYKSIVFKEPHFILEMKAMPLLASKKVSGVWVS